MPVARCEAMRQATCDYSLPEGACNTYRALFHGLQELEADLHQHIHLENNILFPRAAELGKGGAGGFEGLAKIPPQRAGGNACPTLPCKHPISCNEDAGLTCLPGSGNC